MIRSKSSRISAKLLTINDCHVLAVLAVWWKSQSQVRSCGHTGSHLP